MNTNALYKDTDKNVNVEIFSEWESFRPDIYPMPVSSEYMPELSEHSPVSKRFLDFYICYCIRLTEQERRISFMITNEMLESWGISRRELEAQTEENLKNDGYWIKNMREVLGNLMDEDLLSASPLPMYVMTNQPMLYGAAGILRKDMISELAERLGADLYILPSSVQELIFVPAFVQTDVEELNQIIKTINQMQVPFSERLSDHAYYYDRKTGVIQILDQAEKTGGNS